MPQRHSRDQIIDSLRGDLLSGRFPAGARLSELELAERFGVSRGPIRESLCQLTNEGLLVAKPNCGVTVALQPSNEIQELIVPIRRTIETYALRQVFHKLTEEDFQAWEAILDKMEQACQLGNDPEIVLQDIAFHRHLIARAEHADLLAIWQSILARIRGHFYKAVVQYRDRLIQISDLHRQLLGVFRQGNLEQAEGALSEHIW